MKYSEKEHVLEETLNMLSKTEGFSELREKCEQINADGILSDMDIEKFMKEGEIKENLSREYELHKMHILSVQRDTELLNSLLKTEATGVDTYFALKKYKSKYVSNPNFVDRFTSSSIEDNEWAKQFFVKEDGTLKTKKEINEEIKSLHVSLGMDNFDGSNDHRFNRKESREHHLSEDVTRLAQILSKGDSVGLLGGLKTYSSMSNIVYDFKDQITEKIVTLKEELASQQHLVKKDIDLKNTEINNLGLTDEFRQRCMSQISTFGNDLSTGDRYPSPIERLRKANGEFEDKSCKTNVVYDAKIKISPKDIEKISDVILDKKINSITRT